MNLNFLKILKPDWKRIVLFVILFLILPQRVSNSFIFFGGVSIIKFLFESYPPDLDLSVTVIVLIISYLLSCLLVWIYDNKINKFIVSEGEVDVSPPEERESKEKGEEEQKEEGEGPP